MNPGSFVPEDPIGRINVKCELVNGGRVQCEKEESDFLLFFFFWPKHQFSHCVYLVRPGVIQMNVWGLLLCGYDGGDADERE